MVQPSPDVSGKSEMKQKCVLTPAQRETAEGLKKALPGGGVFVLRGGAGSGKTTVLEWLQAVYGGALLRAGTFMQSLAAGPPAAIEEAFLRMVEDAMQEQDIVFVDD